jgi:hypothetical protein
MIFSASASHEPALSTAYLYYAIDQMRKSFGFPRLGGTEILQKINETNGRLESTLGRKFPPLVAS